VSDLSDESKALLESGRDVLFPSADDRARVAKLLSERLGPGALVEQPPPVSVPDARRWAWWKLTGAAVGVGVAGLFLTLREPAPEPPRPQPSPAASVPPRRMEMPSTPSATSSVLPVPAPIERRPAATANAPLRDSLSEEVALLSRATEALRAAHPLEALKRLDEHQRRFPNGRLVEERLGARIRALCALERRVEAEAELARLSRAAPRSPQLARARAACGFPPP